MTLKNSCIIFFSIFLVGIVHGQNRTIVGGDRIDWIDNPTWQSGVSPGYTNLASSIVDSYVICNNSLTFNGNHTYLNVFDTLIVYGDVTFNASSGAAVNVGPDNVLIIFGNLDMGKNHAGIDIGSGGMVIVTGDITSSGTGGDITGDGTVYTDGSTSGMSGGNTGGEHPIDQLEETEGGKGSIEEFVKGGGATPLPVTLTYFKAEAKSAVLLTWATSTEINNNYFVVQRSEDGSYFYEVGRVDGHGNSKQTIEYQFEDHSHFAPVAYYRLKQVDYDGAYEYSPVQRVEIRTQGTQRTVNIFPYEVANGRLTVQSNQPLILQQRVIYSTSGARYTQVPTLQLSNAHGVELNVDNLPAGLYILRLITSEGQKVTGNFLVP